MVYVNGAWCVSAGRGGMCMGGVWCELRGVSAGRGVPGRGVVCE